MAASPRAPVAATLFAVVAFLMTRCAVAEPPPSERSALLAFLAATRQHERRSLGWDASAPACGWAGVTCDAANSTVVVVRLPGVGIAGAIPRGTLGRLANLRVLSLRANRVVGTIPGDLLRLPRLRALYLQQNLLSGATILTRIARLGGGLERLVLSRNNLSGHIPSALGNLTALQVVRLDGNRLSGSIPSMILAGLAVFNVSNNDLSGSIPKSFARFPPDSFAGNRHLCGDPLPPCGGSRF